MRQGTYYFSLALMTAGVTATGSITVSISSTGGPAPGSGPVALRSGAPQNYALGPVNRSTLFNGAGSYTIEVPQGATRLEIRLVTSTPGVDVDLFARFGQDTTLSGGDVVADHSSTGPLADELIVVTPTSSPPLRAGTYYVSLALYTTGVTAAGALVATVTSGSQIGRASCRERV